MQQQCNNATAPAMTRLQQNFQEKAPNPGVEPERPWAWLDIVLNHLQLQTKSLTPTSIQVQTKALKKKKIKISSQ